MCVNEIKIKNPKYLPSIKNNGNPPKAADEKLEYINVPCGWCIECRQKLANDWKIRLQEELKSDSTAQFITLTFKPEAIKNLKEEIKKTNYKELEGEEIDVNILAAFAIRRFTERWRKKYKKYPKYWLITELGHTNTRRLHFHGIIFTKEKNSIEKIWKYGQIYIGEYVTDKTINYITKYVTKIDEINRGYKQKIFCSKKIGINFIIDIGLREYKFKNEKTKEYYKTKEGFKLALPRYYKEKLFNEEEREKLRLIHENENIIYVDGEKINKKEITGKELNRKIEEIRKTSEEKGYGNRMDNNKRYIITKAMEEEGYKNYNKEKEIRFEKKRIIKDIKITPSNKDKSTNCKYPINHIYTGTTTKGERNRNEEIIEANSKGMSIRELRLEKAGIKINKY